MDLSGTRSSLGNENCKNAKKTVKTVSSEKVNDLLLLYTNADSLSNKLNELKLVINYLELKPSIIAITEVKHKNKWQTRLSELALNGYNLYSNDLENSPRGTVIYVNNKLKSKQMHLKSNAL